MKSWLLDADMNLEFSHQEDEMNIYTLKLSFTDLYDNRRWHLTNIELPHTVQPKTRISFTALSSVDARVGIIAKVSDLEIEISVLNNLVTLPNSHTYDFRAGDIVYLVEHLGTSEEQGFVETIIPFNRILNKEMLCLQSVNAEILGQDDQVLYRLSMSPLDKGIVYAKSMAA